MTHYQFNCNTKCVTCKYNCLEEIRQGGKRNCEQCNNKKETIHIGCKCAEKSDGKPCPYYERGNVDDLPCKTCKDRYSLHCPTCEWNKKGKVKNY